MPTKTSYIQDGMTITLIDGVVVSQTPVSGEGIARCFHPDGSLAAECPMKYGRNHGTCRSWHQNGKLADESYCVYGMTIGLARSWDRNGLLIAESDYVLENAVIGRVYDDLGKVHRVFLWNGKPLSKSRWTKKVLADGIDPADLEKRISASDKSHPNESQARAEPSS